MPLGSGARVPGGWRLSGLSLPAKQNLYIRARGFYGTGVFNGSGSIVESIALKTYQRFSDDPLTAGSSPIRVVHIAELRTRIDVLRVRFGLAPFAWTDPSLAAGMTVSSGARDRITDGLTAGVHGRRPATASVHRVAARPGSTSIKVVHIQQLRDAVIVLEAR